MPDAMKISREVRDLDTQELLGWVVAERFEGMYFSIELPVIGRLDFPWVGVADTGYTYTAIGCKKDTQLSLIRRSPGFVEYKA